MSGPSAIESELDITKTDPKGITSVARENDSVQGKAAQQQSVPTKVNAESHEKGAQVSTDHNEEPGGSEAKKNGVGVSTDVAQSNSEALLPTTTAPEASDLSLDMIFDGMDVEGSSKPMPDDLNFDDMDFTVTNNGDQDIQLDNTASGDLDLLMFGEPSGDNNNTNTENVTSLLPGLGDYANADDGQDFDMSSFLPNDPPNDAKKTADSARPFQGEPKQDTNDDILENFGSLPNESNFDDLLNGMDFGDAGDDNTGGEMMEGNDEFDNAFFGID